MSKTPIKVLIRARPTANFAHQNINIDENTGYPSSDSAISTLTSRKLPIRDSSITNRKIGDSSSTKLWPTHPRKSYSTSSPKILCCLLLKATQDASCAMGRLGQAKHFRWQVPDQTTSIGASSLEPSQPCFNKSTHDMSTISKFPFRIWNFITKPYTICSRTISHQIRLKPCQFRRTTRVTSLWRGRQPRSAIIRKKLWECFSQDKQTGQSPNTN